MLKLSMLLYGLKQAGRVWTHGINLKICSLG